MSNSYCHGCMEQITAYPCPHCGYVPSQNTSGFSLRPGTVLNKKYLVGKMIGQGGFGISYIGMDLQLQRKVAIKEYYPTGCVGRKNTSGHVLWYESSAAQEAKLAGQELVLLEARKMSKVGGIGAVVQVFDVFQENDTAYICMDYIRGETLLARLKKTGPLPWAKAEKIFLPVMDTMGAVHKVGLVHRDLSPDNLMIQPDGKVKILDLGAAKDLNLASSKTSVKVAKNGFSPPEQYMDRGKSGSWTDVYALAATMYYTLTGTLPPASIDRMNNDTIRWDLPALQALPPTVLAALQKAMVLRTGERLQTMSEFSQAIRNPTANIETVTGENKKPPKKWLIAAATAAVAAVCAVAAVTLIPKEEPQPETVPTAVQSDEFADEIDARMSVSQKESYAYQNGARMDMYFDAQNNEVLRIFTNELGEEEFVFFADYDANGSLLSVRGYEDRVLMREVIYDRDENSNFRSREERDGSRLLERTEVQFGSDGREVSRKCVDGKGNILYQATSTYDSTGKETYICSYSDGSRYVSIYAPDGKVLDSVSTDSQGKQEYHAVYTYNSAGQQTEYTSYDTRGAKEYSMVYTYDGELQTGYTSTTYLEPEDYITETSYVFGPRDIVFGEQSTSSYGSKNVCEDVKGLGTSIMLRRYTMDTDNTTYYYNWDGNSTHYESYDADGKLVSSQKTLYDDNGNSLGNEFTNYNDDGTYTVNVYDNNFDSISTSKYSSSGKLVEQTRYLYNADGEEAGSFVTKYNEDGSYIENERDTEYHTIISRTFDTNGMLINLTENRYDADGVLDGSTSTDYYYDGSYTVTETDRHYFVTSQKTYDANGNLIS